MKTESSRPLSAVQQAYARQITYELFGRLFLEPVTEELLPYLEQIPELASALPEVFEADEVAAHYQRLFGYHLYPFGAIFLDESGLVGGQIASEVALVFQESGFVMWPGVEADHLGQCLNFLGFLAGREAGGETAVRQAQLSFLEQQLLPWLVPCLTAVQLTGDGFYGRLADLTLELVADHYGSLRREAVPASIPLPAVGEGLSLEDGKTGLRDIARFLVRPVRSGLYIGRGDINRLARSVELPHGFGTREQMLETLLSASGQYGMSGALLGSFQALLAEWRGRYQAAEGLGLGVFVRPWLERLAGSEGVLGEMAGAVE